MEDGVGGEGDEVTETEAERSPETPSPWMGFPDGPAETSETPEPSLGSSGEEEEEEDVDMAVRNSFSLCPANILTHIRTLTEEERAEKRRREVVRCVWTARADRGRRKRRRRR